jgi:signal transduction histidine kinase
MRTNSFVLDISSIRRIERRAQRDQRRHERFALIARVGHLVAANLQLEDLLERAADAIHGILGYENVAIPLIDSADPRFMVLTAFGGAYKKSIGGTHRLPISRGLMGAAATTREVVLVNDVHSDPRYLPTPGTPGDAELAVPILLGDRVLGVLNVESMRPFGADDAYGLRIVADQLAVAIENARLHEAAQRVAVLEERQRLARELHDSVTQQLFSAVLVAQTIGESYRMDRHDGDERCAALLKLSRAALSEMRALLAELNPTSSDGRDTVVRRDGVVAALRAQAQTTEMSGMRVAVRADGWAPQDEACEEGLYRIAREALHNVVKHAGASRVEVALERRGGAALLTVRDDGCGFDPERERARGRNGGEGIGMFSMRQRAADLGGELMIESSPGRGTLIEARVPLRVEAVPA